MPNEITNGSIIRVGFALNTSAFSTANRAILNRLPRDLRYQDDLMNNKVTFRDRYVEIESTAGSEWKTKAQLVAYMNTFLSRYQWSIGRVVLLKVIRKAPRYLPNVSGSRWF